MKLLELACVNLPGGKISVYLSYQFDREAANVAAPIFEFKAASSFRIGCKVARTEKGNLAAPDFSCGISELVGAEGYLDFNTPSAIDEYRNGVPIGESIN